MEGSRLYLCVPEMPTGQIPVLELDGKTMIPQSLAIGRFVAKKTKTYGSNDLEAARIDALIDSAAEIQPKILSTIRAVMSKNEDLKVYGNFRSRHCQ